MPRRKTYGYLLLVFLVISGLAGTPTSNLLSKKERKYAAELLKNSKSDLLESIKESEENNTKFNDISRIQSHEYQVYHLVSSESQLWNLLEESLRNSGTPEKKSFLTFSDNEIVNGFSKSEFELKFSDFFSLLDNQYQSINEAIYDFKKIRTAHIKYIKSTSEDLRDHFVQLPIGLVDCYQLSLLIAAHSNFHNSKAGSLKD